jgi:quinoprotein dehydrogenase-associated probable ABC transporter substrate-binding protein
MSRPQLSPPDRSGRGRGGFRRQSLATRVSAALVAAGLASAALAPAALISAAMVVAGTRAATAQTSDLVTRNVLRVCADPANMPFSNTAGEGFENKIADLIASKLGVPVEYTWFPQATGFVRMTLGLNRCDVIIGFAQGDELVQNTNHYYRSTYVFVTKADGPLAGVTTMSDPLLKDKRIGVVAGTPPATILAQNGLIAKAKGYSLTVDRRFQAPTEDMIADISSGAIDGGLLWGPIGGYYAKQADVPLKVVALPKEAGSRMTYRITMGVRSHDQDWKRRLNRLIRDNQDEINAILADYGVPLLDEQDNAVVVETK